MTQIPGIGVGGCGGGAKGTLVAGGSLLCCESCPAAFHPDCLSIFRNTNEYGYGWRHDDYGYHYFWYYRLMRDVFRYDDENFRCNHKGG